MLGFISIASDHNGVNLKSAIKSCLGHLGYIAQDFGCHSEADSVDYPDYASIVVNSVTRGKSSYGILICSSGIGMSIAANRCLEIRAALCHNIETAQLAREHNDANILCLGAKYIDSKMAEKIVEQFLITKFAQGRHSSRVSKLAQWKSSL